MTGPSRSVPGLLAGLLVVVSGCAPQAASPEGSKDFAPFRVSSLPEDAQRTFVDFGGKLHLVGYSVSPTDRAGPGDAVTLKLYWKPVGKLEKGWSLFTHLENVHALQLWNFDKDGAFRGILAGKPEGL